MPRTLSGAKRTLLTRLPLLLVTKGRLGTSSVEPVPLTALSTTRTATRPTFRQDGSHRRTFSENFLYLQVPVTYVGFRVILRIEELQSGYWGRQEKQTLPCARRSSKHWAKASAPSSGLPSALMTVGPVTRPGGRWSLSEEAEALEGGGGL